MGELKDLNVGDKIYFLEGDDVLTIRGKKGHIMVATEPAYVGHTYSIIDTKQGVCGTHDRTFNTYDFGDKSSIMELIDDMLTEKYGIKLSRRTTASVSLVLNMPRTLQQIN